jgi:hypothetical protein
MNLDIEDFEVAKKLKELFLLKSSGKLSIEHKIYQSHVATIFYENGLIVSAQYDYKKNLKAIFQLFVDEVRLNPYVFHFELQEIDQTDNEMELSYEELIQSIQSIFPLHFNAQGLRPPTDLKMILDPNLIDHAHSLDGLEFEIASLLTDEHEVLTIYNHSPLHEYETTLGLASLRKKGLLKVISENRS